MKTRIRGYYRRNVLCTSALSLVLAASASAQSRTIYMDAGKVARHIRSFQGREGFLDYCAAHKLPLVLPRRTEIHYENNGGYALTIDRLPGGNAGFTVQRFRIDGSKNLTKVEEKTGRGGKLELSNPLPPKAWS